MGTITYNTTSLSLQYIYRATSGGTVFSANEIGNAVFDYFDDTAVVNDCIYFGRTDSRRPYSDLLLNVGTAMSGTDIVLYWEYYNAASGWIPIEFIQDDTNGLTTTGANTVNFGFPWRFSATRAVNGVSACWVRCRIHSLTSITEGGANQTDIVSAHDGDVDITGYTDASPCTFDDVRDYLNTNAPWINCTKDNNNVFDFTQVNLDIDSPLLSTKEVVQLGCYTGGSSAPYCNYSDLSYLQMGTQAGTSKFGYNGSTILISGTNNSSELIFSSTTKMYGSTLRAMSSEIGYISLNGTWYDCNWDGINVFNGTGDFQNCRFVGRGIWILTGWSLTNFDNNKVLISGALGFIYNGSLEIKGLDWASTGAYNFLRMYQTQSNPTFTFTDPVTPMTTQGTPNANFVYRSDEKRSNYQTFVAHALSKVYFYDASAGTYTDYTTEFNDATTGNAPIHGDVGDCYYIATDLRPPFAMCFRVLTSLTSNDYEYKYYYYSGGDWREFGPVWDETNNFITNNELIRGGHDNYATYPALSTINGYSSYWTKIEITSKGTGTPMIDRMFSYNNCRGCGSWKAYEKYTLNLNVSNQENESIENATVKIYDNTGTLLTTETTDSIGDIEGYALTNRTWYFDPIKNLTDEHWVMEDTEPDYTFIITKSGYKTIKQSITMNKVTNLRLKMDRVLSYNQHKSVTQ